MCRRRLFKSNFYINYGGTKKAHGETVIVSPFVAGGASDTFELYARNPWVITNTLSWLTVSSLGNKSGKYAITITATENQAYSERSGSFTAKTLDNRFSIVVSVSQQAKTNEKSISISPRSVDMGAKETYNSLICYFTNTGTTTEVVPRWSTNSSAVTVDTNGKIETNNTGGSLTVTVTATYEHEGDVLTDTMTVNVAAADIKYELILEPQGSTTLGFEENCTFKLYYITKINGTEVSREEVTSNITWDPIATEKGHMEGTTFVNEWFSTAQTTVSVCATYGGIESNNVVLTLSGADSITYALVVTPGSSSINYNGTSQMSAEYITYANGVEHNRETVQPNEVSWGENSTASTISSSGLLTASNNSSANTVTVTVTGTYNGVSDTTNVTIGKAPGLIVRTPSNWHLSSGSGENIFYVDWASLKPNTTIVLNDENIKTYNPVEIPITTSNYTGGTATINFEYDANPNEESRKIYLYASGTGLGNETRTDSDYFEQSAKTIERIIQVSVNGKVSSSAGGTCTNYIVSWTGLTVGSIIDMTADNASLAQYEIEVTATTGSVTIENSPIIFENAGSSRSIRVVGEWRPNTAITGSDQWSQQGGYVPPVSYTYELEVTPSTPGTKPYSGSQAFVATLYRLSNGTRDGWSENVTEYVDWNISTDGGDFIKSGITTGGTAEWVNLSSSTGQVTVSAWLDEPDYGSPSSNEVVFNVNGVSITSTLALTPATTALDYGESVTYTATVTIRHDSTTVFSQTYTFVNWDSDALSIAPDSNTYLTHDVNSKFDYSNASEQETSVTITCSYRETVAEFLPSGAHIDGTAQVTLNEYVEPVTTYSVTFVCSPVAEEVSYTSTNGRSGDSHGVTNWTSTGFSDGDTISYTATKSGYDTVTGTATINGSDLTIDINFVESTSDLTIYYQKDTDDSRNYTVVTTLATTDGSWTKSMTGDTGSVDGGKTWKIAVPEAQTGKTFTISFRQLTTTLFDEVSFGGPHLNGITADSLSGLNEALSSYTFDNLDYTALKFDIQHILTGTVTLDCGSATNYESVSILLNGNTIVTSTVSEPQSGTFTYTSSAETFEIGMGSALGDGNRYKRFAVRIEDKNGNTLYDDTCRYLYPNSNPDYAGRTLTAAQLDGSVWYLYNLSNWGDITIYPASPQAGVSGNTVSGNRSNVTIQINWSGLSNGTMTVSLPDDMTYDGSNTITIPISSSNGNVTRLVSMPANTGSVATGSDITYTIRATATDVNSDTISGDGTIIHQYYYYSAPTIQLMESSSIVPLSTGYTNVHWGQLTNDELDINVQCNDCNEISIHWDSELEITMFFLTNATDTDGNVYVENNQHFYPTYQGGMVTLTTDVSKQISEVSCQGTLTLEGKNSYGDITTITIAFTP